MGNSPHVEVESSDLLDIAALQAKAHGVCLEPLIKQIEQLNQYFARLVAPTAMDADTWAMARQMLTNAHDAQEAISEAQRLLLKHHPDRRRE